MLHSSSLLFTLRLSLRVRELRWSYSSLAYSLLLDISAIICDVGSTSDNDGAYVITSLFVMLHVAAVTIRKLVGLPASARVYICVFKEGRYQYTLSYTMIMTLKGVIEEDRNCLTLMHHSTPTEIT